VPARGTHAQEARLNPARSWLFVPGDSERKQLRGIESAADALILDLEDSVAPTRRGSARQLVRALLDARRERRTPQLWVRVNALSSGQLLDDLIAVAGGAPDGIVLPKISSAAEVIEVQHYLVALERREAIEPRAARLLVIATETPRALLELGGYVHPPSRLAALTWGAEDLSAALGARGRTEEDGSPTTTFELARSLCVITAAAAGVQAVDGVHPSFRDTAGLERELVRARRDGFTGKLAIHPDQVEPINRAFTPSDAELDRARRIVAAFAASPDVGVTSVDGQMIDRPHLVQAQRLLEAAERLLRRK
jgi:citrate lyase subunit beta / citryl-CoA lyase